MSAIWGFIPYINVSEDEMNQKAQILKDGYKNCVIDRYESFVSAGCVMGCGIQYFTSEASDEVLPIVDEENEIFFTADVVLDNREEIMDTLGITDKTVPDGRLLFEMFHRYKDKCLNDLLGAYAFVYYDKKSDECYIVNDSTSTRSLHYVINKDGICFSTLIEPISKVIDHKQINMQWIVDFLAMDNLGLSMDYDKTPYDGIERMIAAHYIKISKGNIEKKCYWNPTVKDIKGKADKEYKEMFKTVFSQAVKRMMRNENMVMLLSGGLDSTSVACFAAKEAKISKKTLTTITSVPEKGFECSLGNYYVTDESENVLKTKEFLEKKGTPIECEFMDLQGINSWDERHEELDILEIPYKSMQNLLWIKEGMRRTYKNGARIIMTGGYGNLTISNSFTSVYQYELIRRFRWFKFIQDSIGYKRAMGLNNKAMIKIAYKIFKDSFKTKEESNADELVSELFVNKDTVEKYDIKNRLKKDTDKNLSTLYSSKKSKELIKNDMIFYQMGETQTKHSLATGVILRDPTIDKRLIELCMQLPVELYSQKGVTRRLVREYLADEMPEHVIKANTFGIQSADTVVRLQKQGDRIFAELEEIFLSKEAKELLDVEFVMEKLREAKKFDAPNRNFEILKLEYTAMAIEYIKTNFN